MTVTLSWHHWFCVFRSRVGWHYCPQGKCEPLSEILVMDFKNVKKQILQKSDLSKKGSIDESIVDLVNYINEKEDYVTTSSCSGRAVLFTAGFEFSNGNKKSKKDCKWLFTSHDAIDVDEFLSKVDPTEGDLIFKFEPFILHVQCSSIEKAKLLHTAAISAGFRDSGITIGKHGKVTLAIRSSLRLEVPISQSSVMLVSDIYLKFLMELTNEKMATNQMNIDQFFAVLKDSFKIPNDTSPSVEKTSQTFNSHCTN